MLPIWDPPPPCKKALNLGIYFPGGRLGRCNLPRETGFCRAAFTRYYYNTSSGNCESFIWGGCGGNANNFNTLDECKKACMRKYIRLISRPAIARDQTVKTVFYSGLHAVDSRFSGNWIPDSIFFFFFFVELRIPRALFWIPKPRIPDSTCKKFSDSGIQIPLHETIVNRTLLPTADSSEILGESCRRLTETSSPL